MADQNLTALTPSSTSIRIGDRVYEGQNWTRKDVIYRDGEKIGFISLSRNNRKGTTVSTISGKRVSGRNVEWCVTESRKAPRADSNHHKLAA